MNNSIGNKIRRILIGSIVLIAVFAIIMLLVNQISNYSNNRIITTMTKEYSIISYTQNLVQAYNNVFKNPGNTQFTKEYTKIHTSLTTTLTQLKKDIIFRESAILFVGVENSVNKVLKSCDTGILEIQSNNFQNISSYYAEANKYNIFVGENTTALIQKELQHLSQTQKDTQELYLFTLFGSLSIFILIVLSMTLYARSFSKQLILPLTNLSVFAKDIADGKLEIVNEKPTETTSDEIGSLSKSIHTMVTNLVQTLNQKQQAAEEIKKSSQSLVEKNAELERLNKLMVDRELKMIEMKKEIAELKESKNLHS